MNRLVRDVVEAIERGDSEHLRDVLHPYVRWTAADGRALRGRNNVLAYLAASSPTEPPLRYETRDSQIYRWTERAAGRL